MLLRNLVNKRLTDIPRTLIRKNFKLNFTSNKYWFGTTARMAEHGYMGNSLQVILDRLEEYAPLELAHNWDNVGLLVDPMTDAKICNVLLTNDLTEEIVQEAVKTKSGLIISYHPNIFEGLKSVSQKSWKERIVVQCIKNGIAVFSPHTSWDAVQGGVNDWLCSALPIQTSQAIMPIPGSILIGAGRICTLQKGITLAEAVRMIKKHIGIPFLRLALGKNSNLESLIYTVAFCAGSGNSVLSGVDADLYVTGEMMHHDILNATQKNINVILCNHSDSERGFLKVFQKKLELEILKGEAKVFVSSIDKDPLQTV